MKQPIHICMTLDKSGYEKHKADVAIILDKPVADVTEGDFVKLKYQTFVHYFRDLARVLKAVGKFHIHPTVGIQIQCEQLKEGHTLVYKSP